MWVVRFGLHVPALRFTWTLHSSNNNKEPNLMLNQLVLLFSPPNSMLKIMERGKVVGWLASSLDNELALRFFTFPSK
jgi:hypothetical protein